MKNDIENTLKILFDYQKFEQEPTLSGIIDEVRMKSRMQALGDDDIELATAGVDLPNPVTADPIEKKGPDGKPLGMPTAPPHV